MLLLRFSFHWLFCRRIELDAEPPDICPSIQAIQELEHQVCDYNVVIILNQSILQMKVVIEIVVERQELLQVPILNAERVQLRWIVDGTWMVI